MGLAFCRQLLWTWLLAPTPSSEQASSPASASLLCSKFSLPYTAALSASQLFPRGLSSCQLPSRGGRGHRNWTSPFSFQFSGLDASDSVEPLGSAVGHPKPAAAPYPGLCFPQVRGPALICIINFKGSESVWAPEQPPQPHTCHPRPGTLLPGDQGNPGSDVLGCGGLRRCSKLGW